MPYRDTYNRVKELASSALGVAAIHASYRAVFTTPEGQRVLRHICKKAFVFDSTFCKDPHEMAVREGHRALALAIMRYVGKDTEQLLKEIEQHNEDTP